MTGVGWGKNVIKASRQRQKEKGMQKGKEVLHFRIAAIKIKTI
jgi:hypothetical protein